MSKWLFCVCCLLLLSGCQSAYFRAMEKVGYHKRDILVSRVNDARDEQERTAKQIRSTLDNFRTVVNFRGGRPGAPVRSAATRSGAQ